MRFFAAMMKCVYPVTHNQRMYCHLTCALVQATKIVKIDTFFASIVVKLIHILQSSLHEICDDLRQGRLNDKTTNLEVRKAMEKILKPNPKLASMIKRECPKNNWACVISRIWPNTMFIIGVLNGSMQQYVPILKYFARDIQLISFCYFVNECNIVDLNLELDYASNKVEYMIWLETPYFEFNPFVDASNNDNFNNDNTREAFQVVDLANVELEKKI